MEKRKQGGSNCYKHLYKRKGTLIGELPGGIQLSCCMNEIMKNLRKNI